MRDSSRISFLVLVAAAVLAGGCQAVPTGGASRSESAVVADEITEGLPEPTPAPAGKKDWFVRTGAFGIVHEVGLDEELGPVFAVGRRLEDDWFVEGEVAIPRAELEVPARSGGRTFLVEDDGRIFFYMLKGGKEIPLDDAGSVRARVFAGLGWFMTNSLTDNEESWATTVGAAVELRLHDDLWGRFGIAHYGLWFGPGRYREEYRHSVAIDLSLVFDF